MSNALILDFDGPLFSTRSMYLPGNHYPNNKDILKSLALNENYTYCTADPVAVALLNRLYEREPYDIVVSSSWAEHNNAEQIKNLLEYNNIEAPLHHNWCTPRQHWDRLYQVKGWIDTNACSNYMIIDDFDSAQSLLKPEMVTEFGLEHLVIVSVDNGISYQDYQHMTQIMNRWNQKKKISL